MNPTEFCPWYRGDQASERAPSCAGFLQIKLIGSLIRYPTGRSAMIHYEMTSNVLETVASFAKKLDESVRFRHLASDAYGLDDIRIVATTLTKRFAERFGLEPSIELAGERVLSCEMNSQD